MISIIGQRQGTWTIISIAHKFKPGNTKLVARCDCGREKLIATNNWRSGSGTKTCTCHKRSQYNQLPDGEASLNMLFAGYIRKAAKRRIEWKLNIDQFRELTKLPCAYCGKPPSQSRKTTSGTPYLYSGVDRINPKSGYIVGNVNPCCKYCNYSKSDLTLIEWREHIRSIANGLGIL
jgi:hypothetical protein